MLRTSRLVVTLLLLAPFAGGQAPAVGKEQLLDRWAEALGGRARLEALKGVHSRQSLETAGLKGSVETWSSAQGCHKQNVVLGPDHWTTVFDGDHAWIRNTLGKVHTLSGTDLEDEVTSAYFESFSQFFPGRRQGTIEYLGEDAATRVYKLKIAPEGGRAVIEYLDPATGLPIKEERAVQERTLSFYFNDWKDFDGIRMWLHGRQSFGDPKFDALSVTEVVEWDPALPAALFTRPEPGPPDFRFSEARSASIPIEFANNHIYVQTSINGQGPFWFIFDTGADSTVLNGRVVKVLGLKAEGAMEGRGAGEASIEVGMVNNVTLQLGSAELSPRPLASAPLDPLEPREGRSVDGILGYDVISSFVAEIDYAGRHIHLYDPRDYRYTGTGTVLPIGFAGNIPVIEARVTIRGDETLPVHLLVDTGDRSALDLNAPFVQSHGVLQKVKSIGAPAGFGVGGEAKERLGRIPELRVGGFDLHDLVAGLSQDVKGAGADPEHDGLFGGDSMRRFRTIFDYTGEKMILEPGPDFRVPFEYDMSGLLLVSPPPDFRVVKVERVVPGSAGADAGLQAGDLITALDGRPCAQFTLQQIKDLFRVPGHEYRLGVRRGDKDSEVRLKTRRLI